jgi:hypothetical protein
MNWGTGPLRASDTTSQKKDVLIDPSHSLQSRLASAGLFQNVTRGCGLMRR